MKFKYRELSLSAPFSRKGHLFRPIILVSLKSKIAAVRYEALIDSGADFCIFPAGIARKLKIILTKLKKIYFSSATGDLVEGAVSNVYLDIGGESFKTRVVFAETLL